MLVCLLTFVVDCCVVCVCVGCVYIVACCSVCVSCVVSRCSLFVVFGVDCL